MKRTPLERTTRLTRSSPLPRGETPRRRKPIRKRSPKTGGHRFPKLVNEALREFVRGCQCLGCDDRRRRSQPHHVKTRGAGGADWNNLVPLCARCHSELHTVGRHTFEARLRRPLAHYAELVTLNYQAWSGSAHPGAPTP